MWALADNAAVMQSQLLFVQPQRTFPGQVAVKTAFVSLLVWCNRTGILHAGAPQMDGCCKHLHSRILGLFVHGLLSVHKSADRSPCTHLGPDMWPFSKWQLIHGVAKIKQDLLSTLNPDYMSTVGAFYGKLSANSTLKWKNSPKSSSPSLI